MDLEQLATALADKNLKVVEKRTEIPYHRLYRIAKGKARRPLVEDVDKLRAYLNNN